MPDISFIIATFGTNDARTQEIISSIEVQNLPEYEFIIVGGRTSKDNRKCTVHIPFNENIAHRPWLGEANRRQ